MRTLANVRELPGPQFLHVITQKGHGYPKAEEDPILYHGVAKFDPAVGIVAQGRRRSRRTRRSSATGCATWRRATSASSASRRRCAKARAWSGSRSSFPTRYFDVGIAEQHAVTFAAGLACEGMQPVVAIYSTFLQRAYDQLIHDVVLQNLPVVFAIDRAGLVGADGATHIGAFDLVVPALPAEHDGDGAVRRERMPADALHGVHARARRPRCAIRAAAGRASPIEPAMHALPIGKGEVRREGKRRTHRIAILAFGSMLQPALEAAEELDATVANMRFVKPLDVDLVLELAREHDALVTVEENVIAGGAGSAVPRRSRRPASTVPILHLGLPDHFIDHGDPAFLLAHVGLDAKGIAAAVRRASARRAAEPWAKPAA